MVLEVLGERLTRSTYGQRSVRNVALLIVELIRDAVRYAEHRRQRVLDAIRLGRRKVEEAQVFGHGRAWLPAPRHT